MFTPTQTTRWKFKTCTHYNLNRLYCSLILITYTRQVSSMIHSARPTVISGSENCFRLTFVLFWKVVTDGRTNGRLLQIQWSLPAVTVGWRSGSIWWLYLLTYNASYILILVDNTYTWISTNLIQYLSKSENENDVNLISQPYMQYSC